MTKKELKKIASKKIDEGKSRQVTFLEMIEELEENKKVIANSLEFLPPNQTKENYKMFNSLLLLALIVTVIFKLFIGVNMVLENGVKYLPILLILPALNTYFAYSVAKFRIEIYKWLGIMMILSIWRSGFLGNEVDLYFIFDFVLFGIIIFLSFYLKSKMASGYETKREYFTNENGENRGMDVIYFED